MVGYGGDARKRFTPRAGLTNDEAVTDTFDSLRSDVIADTEKWSAHEGIVTADMGVIKCSI